MLLYIQKLKVKVKLAQLSWFGSSHIIQLIKSVYFQKPEKPTNLANKHKGAELSDRVYRKAADYSQFLWLMASALWTGIKAFLQVRNLSSFRVASSVFCGLSLNRVHSACRSM